MVPSPDSPAGREEVSASFQKLSVPKTPLRVTRGVSLGTADLDQLLHRVFHMELCAYICSFDVPLIMLLSPLRLPVPQHPQPLFERMSRMTPESRIIMYTIDPVMHLPRRAPYMSSKELPNIRRGV